jgi:hypothetical protein
MLDRGVSASGDSSSSGKTVPSGAASVAPESWPASWEACDEDLLEEERDEDEEDELEVVVSVGCPVVNRCGDCEELAVVAGHLYGSPLDVAVDEVLEPWPPSSDASCDGVEPPHRRSRSAADGARAMNRGRRMGLGG